MKKKIDNYYLHRHIFFINIPFSALSTRFDPADRNSKQLKSGKSAPSTNQTHNLNPIYVFLLRATFVIQMKIDRKWTREIEICLGKSVR